MGRTVPVVLPKLRRIMEEVGENIRLARLRRDITAQQLAQRAGISRTTLRLIERGDEGVSFGAYANALFCLGLESDLSTLGHDDELGRKLQDAGLGVARRARRTAKDDPL
jgi:transcriptional regulator with XRE-family HTH domain